MGESRRKFDRNFRDGAVRLVRETMTLMPDASYREALAQGGRAARGRPLRPEMARPDLEGRYGMARLIPADVMEALFGCGRTA